MGESTLALKLTDLQELVGHHLGYGRSGWNTEQTAVIADCIESGLRRFYFTEAIPQYGIPAGYPWEFLKPKASLTLESGTRVVDMPDDYGGMEGLVMIGAVGQTDFQSIKQMTAERIRELFGLTPDLTGTPQVVAIEWSKNIAADQGQRAQMLVYPEADTDYTLEFQYYLQPDALTATRPYPYGGSRHAETIKAACLAAAELDLNGGGDGKREDFYLKRLGTSIMEDQRNRPQFLGYNGDCSDERRYVGRYNPHVLGTVQFNSVTYD